MEILGLNYIVILIKQLPLSSGEEDGQRVGQEPTNAFFAFHHFYLSSAIERCKRLPPVTKLDRIKEYLFDRHYEKVKLAIQCGLNEQN